MFILLGSTPNSMDPHAILLWVGDRRLRNTIDRDLENRGVALPMRQTDSLTDAIRWMERHPGVLLVSPLYMLSPDDTPWEEFMMPPGEKISLVDAVRQRIPDARFYKTMLKIIVEGRNEGLLPIGLYGPKRQVVPFTYGTHADFTVQHAVRRIAASKPFALPKEKEAFYDRISELAEKLQDKYTPGRLS